MTVPKQAAAQLPTVTLLYGGDSEKLKRPKTAQKMSMSKSFNALVAPNTAKKGARPQTAALAGLGSPLEYGKSHTVKKLNYNGNFHNAEILRSAAAEATRLE